MYRSKETHLQKWYSKNRRKPLIIRGARQVGKSTLVRNFAKSQAIDLFEINLERHKNLEFIFKESNTKEVLKELSFAIGKGSIKTENSLLFLDEIQATPSAIPLLRYLYEDYPNLAILCAGSLLEFTLADHSYSMPVGRVEYMYLQPMSFSEFLLAHNISDLYELITNLTTYSIPLSAHKRLLECFRDYLLIGGMPEAVLASSEGEDSESIFDIQASIIETYIDDFAKYGKGNQLNRLQYLFKYIPANLGQKVKYSHIDPHSQARDIKPIIDLLDKAGIISKAYHCNSNGLPLRSEINTKVQKLYFLDVGLVNKICGIQHISLEDLKSIDFINKGQLAEQFIAQQFLATEKAKQTPELNYWIREGKANNAEIDFIKVINGDIYPVEVKAGKSGTMKSLHLFMYEKNHLQR